jgi:uncharacterized protein (DUF362 family)
MFFIPTRSRGNSNTGPGYHNQGNTETGSKARKRLLPANTMREHSNADEHAQKTSQVIRVQSPEIILKDFTAANYLDFIDNEKLNKVLEEGLIRITGKNDVISAWLDILINYRSGDKIAIKPNFNSLNHGLMYTITSPQLINAVVKQLVDIVKVQPQNIYVYDLCKEITHDIVRKSIHYPVQYVERMDSRTLIEKIKLRLRYGPASADRSAEIEMRENILDEAGNRLQCYIPRVIVQAHHLINMPLLTNHIYIVNSGAMKNHYGTVRFSNDEAYPVALHGPVLVKSVADINRNPHIKNKTRIIIADGIFGVFDRGEGPGKQPWKTLNNAFPKSIFFSRDPVAIDSVMASFVARERKSRKLAVLSHDYLEEAAKNGLGVYDYQPDGRSFTKIRYEELYV